MSLFETLTIIISAVSIVAVSIFSIKQGKDSKKIAHSSGAFKKPNLIIKVLDYPLLEKIKYAFIIGVDKSDVNLHIPIMIDIQNLGDSSAHDIIVTYRVKKTFTPVNTESSKQQKLGPVNIERKYTSNEQNHSIIRIIPRIHAGESFDVSETLRHIIHTSKTIASSNIITLNDPMALVNKWEPNEYDISIHVTGEGIKNQFYAGQILVLHSNNINDLKNMIVENIKLTPINYPPHIFLGQCKCIVTKLNDTMTGYRNAIDAIDCINAPD